MKIAVIGGGIAGLVVAWQLSRRHAVTLFEREARPGFIASSVEVVDGRGRPLTVDVPLRVFYRGYYPQLTRLYAELGVATEAVSYATTFTAPGGRPYFRYRNLRLGDASWSYVLPPDLVGARARRILVSALRFQRAAVAALRRGELAGRSIGAFVDASRAGEDFIHGLLLPAIATVGTCHHDDALDYPADVVAAYLAGGLVRESVRRARAGAHDVASRLVAGIGRVQCAAGVEAVRAAPGGGVRVARRGCTDEHFDHVVLATQANQARALWVDAPPADAAVLSAFRYRPLEVVMHRDPALMPARRADWSPVHAHVDAERGRTESTIWINRVQPTLHAAPPLFQTVQPLRAPRDELVVSRARFERPLVDAASQQAVRDLQVLQQLPGRRVWLCGSYAQPGVPLLESAVRSAQAVAAAVEVAAQADAAAAQRAPGDSRRAAAGA